MMLKMILVFLAAIGAPEIAQEDTYTNTHRSLIKNMFVVGSLLGSLREACGSQRGFSKEIFGEIMIFETISP